MQLSTHFSSAEFERGTEIPAACIPVFQILCAEILEPIRTWLNREIVILSGYRSPETNAAAHGVTNSEHIATAEYCAADFTFPTSFGAMLSIRMAFDWIRNNPDLPFHQVILEHGANGSSILHISYNMAKASERQALEGATHNSAPYSMWPCVRYVSNNPGLIHDATTGEN
jgi:Peptidase M15